MIAHEQLDAHLRARLLDHLAAARKRREQADEQIRLLLAYGRHFTGPRPYRLVDLARAAGRSPSGVRTAYHSRHINRLAYLLGRDPVDAPGRTSGKTHA
jgi:hypothetical protein